MESNNINILTAEQQLQLRESGRQPIIEIEGHPFFVDIHWGFLRPKDDFSTQGINLSAIDHFMLPDERSYWIPYEPKTHSLKELDLENITSIPKDIVVVEIPCQQRLDPVGFARKYGIDRDKFLKRYPLKMEMKARSVPWGKTNINRVILSNLKKDLKAEILKSVENQSAEKTRRKKGKKL